MPVSGNRYLTQSEMEENAAYIWSKLKTQGWTIQSVCGMLGNMQTESTINPGIWQGLDPTHPQPWGFGLVQWTPSTKYTNWCEEEGIEPDDMDSALERLNYEVVNKIQWYPTSAYPISFAQFKVSKLDPYTLAMMFLKNYERPANPNQPIRGTQAQKWYEYLTGDIPFPPIPPAPGYIDVKLPIYYYLRRF